MFRIKKSNNSSGNNDSSSEKPFFFSEHMDKSSLPLVELRNVSYTYMPSTPFAQEAIKDVSLKIFKGEQIALVGPTGSGKSTLIQLIAGLLLPTKGSIFVNNQKIDQDSAIKKLANANVFFRRQVGIVFQFPENQLFEETVFEDIAFGPRNQGLSNKEIIARVKYAMEEVGLDFRLYATVSPFNLSGGEKRLVAIAGVLAMKPNILILDEPTCGLDFNASRKIMQILSEYSQKGSTVIVVTHNMDDVVEFAKRVVVLNEGKIAFDRSPKNFFSEENCNKFLLDIGLDLPATVKVAYMLKERGFDVKLSNANKKSLVKGLLDLLKN